MDVSAAAIERLRSSIRPDRPTSMTEAEEVPLSPNGNHQPAHARRASAEPVLEPRLTPEDRLGGAAADTAKASRLDFLFRSRHQASPRADSPDPNWPAEALPSRGAPPDVAIQPRYSDVMRAPGLRQRHPHKHRRHRPPPPVGCAGRASASGTRRPSRNRTAQRDPQIRRGRWHGVHALRRRFDRSQAAGRHGEVRVDR